MILTRASPTNNDSYDDSFSENDMEIGQEPTMFTPNDDIADMSNKTPLLATGCTQMVSIHDIISGNVPFPHLNNSKKFTPTVPGFQT